jgi:GTP-binding protein
VKQAVKKIVYKQPIKKESVLSLNTVLTNKSFDEFNLLINSCVAFESINESFSAIQRHFQNENNNNNVMILTTFKAFLSCNRYDLCEEVLKCFNMSMFLSLIEVEEKLDFIRSISSANDIQFMEILADKFKVTFKTTDPGVSFCQIELVEIDDSDEILNVLMSETIAVCSLTASLHSKALAGLEAMERHGLTLEMDASCYILKQFLLTSSSEPITRCIRLLTALLGDNDDGDLLQVISNAYVRDIDFVTGAVSMETLPVEACPEAAFIGRSNVGKSSLINMLTMRSGLAYISKKPGKTSEFNFYDARGVVGCDLEQHRFYLVDVPGVGYAIKSRQLRDDWTNFLRNYVQNRSTLRVLFHLVDSRHGLLEADVECLSLLKTLPAHVQYVIVLTKMDKQRGAEKAAEARGELLDSIYLEVARRTDRVVPILFTSSTTRSGGSSLMSTLLDGLNRHF